MLANCVRGAFADLTAFQVDTAHAGVGGEWHESGAERMDVTLTQVEVLLGQHHDAAAFRCFVCQRSELGGIGELPFG